MTVPTETVYRGGQGGQCPPPGGRKETEIPTKTIKSSTSRTRTVLSTAGGGGHCPPCPPLAVWLATLKQRNISATVHDQAVHLDGDNITSYDHDWLARHHDALIVASAGTHPDWWAGVTTGRHLPGVDIPDIGCAVADCPGDTSHYSPDGIPFCHGHNPDWWRSR